MQFGYNPKNKNTRWPFPTLHIFEGTQDYSHCGLVSKEKIVLTDRVPDILFTVCEKCVYGRPNLRDQIYDKEV